MFSAATHRTVFLGILLAMVASLLPLLIAGAVAPGTEGFQRTWQRTDLPVAEGEASRTWMWGPDAFSDLVAEPYAEAPDGRRIVQYFDKARMEDNGFRGEEPWDITNGLLVVEMVTGRLQIGDDEYEEREPASVNVAGDADDPTGPTYETFAALLDVEPLAIDAAITQRLSRDGSVTDDPSLAERGVRVAHVDEVTDHAIAEPFWEFRNAAGVVYQDEAYVSDDLFQDPNFATGRPISEPYWANIEVAGVSKDVLIQAFERRVLTYTPDNPDGWQVEAGNVGRHYYEWRYQDANFGIAWSRDGFDVPSGVALDDEGHVYVVDNTLEAQIRHYSPDGELVDEWAVSTGEDSFALPVDLAFGPDGRLYVLDRSEYAVFVYTPEGELLDTIQVGVEATVRTTADHLVVDEDGNLYVAWRGEPHPIHPGPHIVGKYNQDGDRLTQWLIDSVPSGLAVSESALYVETSDQVDVFDLDGTLLDQWDGAHARAIAVDSAGDVYMVSGSQVSKFNSEGGLIESWVDPELDGTQLMRPTDAAIGSTNALYVTDALNDVLLRLDLP